MACPAWEALPGTRRDSQIQTKLDQPSWKNGQHQTSETLPRRRRDRGRPRKRWQRVNAGTGQATKSMEEDDNDDFLFWISNQCTKYSISWCDGRLGVKLVDSLARCGPLQQDLVSSVTIDWCLALHRWGFYNTHSDALQSVGLLWTSDELVKKTSTWQHTTLTTDRHPCPRWDSYPRSQQASGRRPTP